MEIVNSILKFLVTAAFIIGNIVIWWAVIYAARRFDPNGPTFIEMSDEEYEKWKKKQEKLKDKII